MDRTLASGNCNEVVVPRRAANRAAKPLAIWIYRAAIVLLAIWVLQSFLPALFASCITAIASWPLYRRFRTRLRPRLGRSAVALISTVLMTVFVLAPMTYAFVSLLNEAHHLMVQLAATDQNGIPVPAWLRDLPLLGPWAEARWRRDLAHPGAIVALMQRTDVGELLGWAQSLGQFMTHHLFIILFTILLLFFFYREGEMLAHRSRQILRHTIGDCAESYVEVATSAVRASVNSMLVVSLFDGFASGIVYAAAGVPNPAVWAAITGALALVPFLGYVAVLAVTLHLGLAGASTAAFVSCTLGCVVLFCGDKVVRPISAREGMQLGFVWILMGCLGGFEAMGLVGLVIGPVVLTLVRELWVHRARELSVVEHEHKERALS